jgi:ribonucleotide monophosphatase NagD (HAD superfamily)
MAFILGLQCFKPINRNGCLVDLDGTLICNRKLLLGAKSLLSKLEHFVLVSNDSEHTPFQLSRMLLRLGCRPLRTTSLAGAFALELVPKERRASSVMFLGGPRLRRYGRRLGLNMTERDPQIVLVACDRNFNYHKLTRAVNAIRASAELVAANPIWHFRPAADVCFLKPEPCCD